jgi:molecular chaperone HscB
VGAVKALQSKQVSPFDVFGLKPSFRLDMADLEHRYLVLQSSSHPDRFALGETAAKREATQRSSEINEAYRQLRVPFDRAAWLIMHGGIPDPLASNLPLPPDFLMEQMEQRECFEDARMIQDKDTLYQLRQQWQDELDILWHQLEQALDIHHNIEGAALYLRQLRFVLTQLDSLEETLFEWECI